MSYTQTQLDALRAAAAKGVKSVSYDGQTVVYASLSEMRAMIAAMEKSLATTTAGRRNRVYAGFERGE